MRKISLLLMNLIFIKWFFVVCFINNNTKTGEVACFCVFLLLLLCVVVAVIVAEVRVLDGSAIKKMTIFSFPNLIYIGY